MTANFNPAGISTLLMGDESLTIACGDMLLAGGHRIAGVITRDGAVQGWAQAHNIPVFETARDVLSDTPAVDWLLSVANLRVIPDDVLALPAKGAINFHDGPLPRYAGLNTPAWAIINGEATHGVSWHMIEGGVDEGDLLAQRLFDIAPDETAFSLNSKCYAAGMESFADVLAQLEAGSLRRTAQDLTQRSYFARDQRPVGAGVLDPAMPADVLSKLFRGLDFGDYWNPLTTAKIQIGGTFVRVRQFTVLEGANTDAGRVAEVSGDALTLGTATDDIRLNGLTDLAGNTFDPSGHLTVGDIVTVGAVKEIPAKDEAHWRARLSEHQMVELPLATAPGTTPDVQRHSLEVATTGSSTELAAVALTVLHSAGRTQGTLAMPGSTDAPLALPWLPMVLSAETETGFNSVAQNIETQQNRIAQSAGVARDLLLRDPALNSGMMPDVGLTLGADMIAGTALTISLSQGRAELIFDANQLTSNAVSLMAERITTALEMSNTAATCADIWTVPQSEQQRLLQGWNATDKPYDRTTVHAAFEAQVARTPTATALVFEGEALDYATLNARANKLAHTLRAMGAAPGTPIGLFTTRSVDLLVGTLGILKAGGAYVPLDPAYPSDRIAHYIADSAAPLIVTQSGLAADLPDHGADLVLIDSDPRLADAPDTNPAASARADDLAYLIYTSGSTGTPKGVMVSHGNVANFFAGMDDRIDHYTGAVWLAVTSLSFDISVLELFWTLARGFKLILAGDDSRTLVSNGPIATSDRKIDFNLMYWGNDDGVGPKKYELLLEGAKFADANGFNAVWTPERHFHAFGGPYPNPSVTGAAVAAVTQNLAVRAGSCVAPLHHPARIAEEWAVIDNLTNGRVGLAIASGWQPDDFVLRPENTPPQNKPAMYDAIRQLRQMWRGEPVEFPKQDGSMHAVVTQPRPVSAELPVWVTTAGNPQTWKEAGEIGANVLTHLLGQSVEEVADKIKIYHQALRDAGHDPADFTVTLMLHTYLAETREAAEAVARGPMKDYLRSAAALIKQYAWAFPAFKRPTGTTNAFDLDLEGLSEEELDAILEFAFQRYFNDSGMFGTVADGVARADALKRIGVDEIACLIDYGIDSGLVMEGLKPLAQVLAQSNQATTLAEDDHSLAAQMIRHKVTHLQCTPSMAQMLVTNAEAAQALGGIKHMMIGGEALPGSLVSRLKDCTTASVQNMYGPTETTIWSTTHPVANADLATTPVGTPIANTQVYVLSDAMGVQPIGVEGELWIGGDGVTQGYWHRDALTAERFVENPYGPGKLYRTGDLAHWDATGCLHFAGRADAQVKIRGHRIELGEIEARLAEQAGVTQAVVSTVAVSGSDQLVGYVVTSGGTFDADHALSELSAQLPDIMVPTQIMQLEAMPLTPNKKIDRKALPQPQRRQPVREAAPAAPASNTQTAIAKVWSTLLGIDDIRGDDNFFALGGHSLLAVQAHRDIKAALGAANLSITDIFRFPTLDGLSGHLDQAGGKDTQPVTPAAQPASSETMSKRRAMRAGRSRTNA